MTREESARQIARLSVFRDTFPFTVEGKQELVDAAIKTGADERLLKLVIDDQVETGDRCFLPAELVRALRAHMAEPTEKPLGDPACEHCDGTGWKVVERGDLSGADPCRCRNQPSEAPGRREGKPTGQAPTVGAPTRPARHQGQQRGNLERAGDLLSSVSAIEPEGRKAC